MAAKKTKKAVKKPEPTKVPKSEARSKKEDSELDEAVNEIMDAIDDHQLSTSEVSQVTTIQFLKGVVIACNERISTIRAEMGEEAEDEEEGDLDDVDIDEDE